MQFIKNLRTGSLFLSFATLLAGLVLAIWPGASAVTICYLMGMVLTLAGLIKLFSYLASEENKLLFQFDLIWAVISMLFGVSLLIKPVWFLTLLNQAIGVFMLIEGLLAMRNGIETKKRKMSAWWLSLITAVISCLFGILLMGSLLGTNLLMIIFGISIIMSALQSIILAKFT